MPAGLQLKIAYVAGCKNALFTASFRNQCAGLQAKA